MLSENTSASPFAVFRADGGAEIGGGHIVRCRALAGALHRNGWRCGLAASAETMSYFEDLPAAFDETALLQGGEPPALARRWPDGCDLMIVDHYGRDRAFEAACRPWARRVLVLDDLADRPHDCDLLLDGTVGRTAAAYAGLIPETCVPLMGADYLPLRPEFTVLRRRLLPRRTPSAPWCVLLCLGAGFVAETILDLVDAFGALDLPLSLDVAIGTPPQDGNLRARLDAMGGRLHVATDAMAQLIADADIAIGAAGVGGWERCCLGLPSVTLILAENQIPNAEALAAAGAARVLPVTSTPTEIVTAVVALMDDPAAWREMSIAATSLCDGLGLARSIERLTDRWHDREGAPIYLRPAVPEDALAMLEWQSDPTTRRYARNPDPPKRDEHLAWFAAKRADPRCLFNTIVRGGAAAGVLRLDRMEYPDAFEVSILVAPEHRRAGLSRAALDLGRRLVSDADLWAYVKPENAASLALFRGAGYAESDRTDWYLNRAREVCRDG